MCCAQQPINPVKMVHQLLQEPVIAVHDTKVGATISCWQLALTNGTGSRCRSQPEHSTHVQWQASVERNRQHPTDRCRTPSPEKTFQPHTLNTFKAQSKLSMTVAVKRSNKQVLQTCTQPCSCAQAWSIVHLAKARQGKLPLQKSGRAMPARPGPVPCFTFMCAD